MRIEIQASATAAVNAACGWRRLLDCVNQTVSAASKHIAEAIAAMTWKARPEAETSVIGRKTSQH
jgi:hypothetical protein